MSSLPIAEAANPITVLRSCFQVGGRHLLATRPDPFVKGHRVCLFWYQVLGLVELVLPISILQMLEYTNGSLKGMSTGRVYKSSGNVVSLAPSSAMQYSTLLVIVHDYAAVLDAVNHQLEYEICALNLHV